MATLVKNFRIKSGLVVEGTTGTINGQNILTETGSDQYILNLIGGETLVKSVSNEFNVSAAGELSIDRTVVDAYYDAAGSASTAQTAAQQYADGLAVNYDAAGSADQAEADANSYTDNKVLDYTKTSDLDSTVGGYGYLKNADLPTMYSDSDAVDAVASALGDGIEYEDGSFNVQIATGLVLGGGTGNQIEIDRTTVDTWYDANGAAATAQAAAEDYADSLIDDASTTSTNTWSAYKTSTEIGLAQAAAEQHADDAVANLVGSAPAVLDTIQELATALQENPDIISDLQDIAAGKQGTLTAGSGIDIDPLNNISVDIFDLVNGNSVGYVPTAEKSGKIAVEETALHTALDSRYDASGAAAQALTDAQSYADTAESDAISSAATYTDGQITNLTDGTNSFQTVNIEDVVAQRAATTSIGVPNQTPVFTWDSSDYRSAKILVKVANGVHTQISELMVTLDTANNVAVSEYGITYSNGSELAAITADFLTPGSVRVLATPANANTDVTVFATLVI